MANTTLLNYIPEPLEGYFSMKFLEKKVSVPARNLESILNFVENILCIKF